MPGSGHRQSRTSAITEGCVCVSTTFGTEAWKFTLPRSCASISFPPDHAHGRPHGHSGVFKCSVAVLCMCGGTQCVSVSHDSQEVSAELSTAGSGAPTANECTPTATAIADGPALTVTFKVSVTPPPHRSARQILTQIELNPLFNNSQVCLSEFHLLWHAQRAASRGCGNNGNSSKQPSRMVS